MLRLLFLSLIIICMVIIPRSASAARTKYGNLICTEVISVYDGDTFFCKIGGIHPLIGDRIGIRVFGVDTPEIRDKRPKIKAIAQEARIFTVEKLRNAKVIELRNVRRGKYFRIVAEVYIDNVSLAGQLLESGLGGNYLGVK
jgi:endonuclease YncB( thermonuclease family)